MFGKQLEKTKPLSLLFNLPGWMGDYPFNANMFFHCNNCSLQSKCLPPVAWVSQPSWLPCREGCLPRADFWHIRGGWEHLKKQNGKDVCSRRSGGRREKRTNHWQTSEEIYWNWSFLASEFNTGAPVLNSQGALSGPLASSCTEAAKTASVFFPANFFWLELNPASICRQEETQTPIDLT